MTGGNGRLRVFASAARRLRGAGFVLIAACLAGGCLYRGPGSAERRFVFVDGGAHYGEAMAAFKGSPVYGERSWELYAIEASPAKEVLAKLRAIPGVRLVNKAMWTSDGTLDLHLAANDSKNSLFSGAVAAPAGAVRVKCFDFSLWVRRKFSAGDLLVLSLDIQGAEYGVLRKMLDDGTAAYVDVLMVELHHAGDEALEAAGKELLGEFRALGTEVFEDSAEGVDGPALEKAVRGRF